MLRQQIEHNVGGKLYANMRTAVSEGSVAVTIKRYNGGPVQGAAVAGVVLADPYKLTLLIGTDSGSDYILVPPGAPVTTLPVSGQWLQVVSASGTTQQVQVRRVDALEGRIYLRQPTHASLSAGDKIHGLDVFVDISAEQTPKVESNYRAVFSATSLSGDRVSAEVIYDVGLRPNTNPATIADLYSAWPNIHSSVVAEWVGTHGDTAVLEGWRAVSDDIWASQKNPNRIRDLTILVTPVVNRMLRYMARFGQVPAGVESISEWSDQLDDDYRADLNKAMNGGLLWYDDDDDGVASESETTPRTSSIVLVR